MDHSNYDLGFFSKLPTSWMAPFCLVRQWMRLYESTEGQRLMWLCSRILCLLVISAFALFSSRVANPSYTACRLAPRSAATFSHKSSSMAISPMSHLHTSL